MRCFSKYSDLLILFYSFQNLSFALIWLNLIPVIHLIAQSSPNLCDHMNCSTPGLPVHHQLPEFTQNSCPLSWWCHPTISSSVIPFSSSLQTFPASGSFPMSQFFTSGGQSIGVSALASVLPMNIQGLISFRIDWLDLLAVQGTQESSPTPQFKSISSPALSFLYGPTLTSIYDWKNHSFD